MMTDEMSWVWSKALIVGFPGGSMVKNLAAKAGDVGSFPG